MFFKRLSRSRSNSQSYVDSYDSRHDSKTNSQDYDNARYPPGKHSSAPVSTGAEDLQRDIPGSRQSNTAPQLADPLQKETGMYARQSQPTEVPPNGAYASPPLSAGGGGGGMSNGYGSYSSKGGYAENASPNERKQPPDLLLQAFNQALRPHIDKVESLENEIADLRAYIDQLEAQRGEVHAWIDKRGLRPGKLVRFYLSSNRNTDGVLQTFHQA